MKLDVEYYFKFISEENIPWKCDGVIKGKFNDKICEEHTVSQTYIGLIFGTCMANGHVYI